MNHIDKMLLILEEQLDESLMQAVGEKIANIWLNYVNHRKGIINDLYKYFSREMEELSSASEIKDFLYHNQQYIRKNIDPKFVITKGI